MRRLSWLHSIDHHAIIVLYRAAIFVHIDFKPQQYLPSQSLHGTLWEATNCFKRALLSRVLRVSSSCAQLHSSVLIPKVGIPAWDSSNTSQLTRSSLSPLIEHFETFFLDYRCCRLTARLTLNACCRWAFLKKTISTSRKLLKKPTVKGQEIHFYRTHTADWLLVCNTLDKVCCRHYYE